MTLPLIVCAVAFLLAGAATPVVRAFARHIGAVAAPKLDRWHKKPTAMMGGVAIYAAVTTTLVLFVPMSKEMWVVLCASTAMFVVGLIDDFLHIKPYQKLIGQLLAAAAIIHLGLVLPWTSSFAINTVITLFWLVGVTNAVNMLDNMDGLSAGVAAIAALFLAVNFFMNGQANLALMLGGFSAALAGFLVYNHNPASIFMGDCGSMFIGFFLASTALAAEGAGGGRSRSITAVLAVPVLVLCIPIFDTTFVTVMRKLSGRAASQGGRDHTSHRLVALGLSEQTAVWMLYGFAILGGLIGVAVRRLQLDVSLAIIAAFAIMLSIVGVYLAAVRVYDPEQVAAAQQKPLVAFLVDLSYKRRVFEVLLDVVLIVLAYYSAFALVFGPASAQSMDWQLFLKTVPAVVAIKLALFLAAGVYRGLWKYASLADFVAFARAVVLGSAFTVMLTVFAFRPYGFSRTVFTLDGLLLLIFLTGSRFAFRVLRRLMPAPHERVGKRVVIYGAGDGGELLFRELRNNSELRCVPVAFIDDDPLKAGKLLHGLRIYSGQQSIPEVCLTTGAEEILLSTLKIPLSRLRAMLTQCENMAVPVGRMKLDIQRIADAELGWVLPTEPISAEPTAAEVMVHSAPMLPIDGKRRPAAIHKALTAEH